MLATWKYRFRDSPIESLDPRARWISSFLLLASVTMFWDIRFLIFFFLIPMTQYFLSRLTWKETRLPWFFIFIFVVVITGVNALITGRGGGGVISDLTPHIFWEKVWHLPLVGWPITISITAEKLAFGISQIVKMFSLATLFFIIPWTMNPRNNGITFKGMGIPYRIAFSMDLAFRLVPTIASDFRVTLDSQRARGYEVDNLKGGIIAKIRKLAPILVPVIMNAIVGGEDIVNAMDLRSFGVKERTWIQELHYRQRDYILMGLGIVMLIASIIITKVYGLGDLWVPDWLIARTL
ncbi:MAG: energy-coupling factor transporter transmembrane component T [Anaerolineales bacterium]